MFGIVLFLVSLGFDSIWNISPSDQFSVTVLFCRSQSELLDFLNQYLDPQVEFKSMQAVVDMAPAGEGCTVSYEPEITYIAVAKKDAHDCSHMTGANRGPQSNLYPWIHVQLSESTKLMSFE